LLLLLLLLLLLMLLPHKVFWRGHVLFCLCNVVKERIEHEAHRHLHCHHGKLTAFTIHPAVSHK